jgi:hypothetical protein
MGQKKEFAPGILDPHRFEPIPIVADAQRWKSVIHLHKAFRAGPHFDLRLLEPGTDNLHSWALRKMPKPGEKALAIQQPTHSEEYRTFKGVIPKGYGAGAVDVHSKKSVKVLSSGPDKVTFEMGKELFTLVKTKRGEKDWLLLNRTKEAQAAGTGFPGSPMGANDVIAPLLASLLKGKKLPRKGP